MAPVAPVKHDASISSSGAQKSKISADSCDWLNIYWRIKFHPLWVHTRFRTQKKVQETLQMVQCQENGINLLIKAAEVSCSLQVEKGSERSTIRSKVKKTIGDLVKTRGRRKRKIACLASSKATKPRPKGSQNSKTTAHKLKKGDKIVFPGWYFKTPEIQQYEGVITHLRKNREYSVFFKGTQSNFPHRKRPRGETWHLNSSIEQFM